MPNAAPLAATWSLPVLIRDVDIAFGFHDVSGCAGYGGVRLLVRRHGAPLGWIDLPCRGDVVSADDVARGVQRQLSRTVRRSAALDAIGVAEQTPRVLPPISIVICTRDRSHLLARALASVARLQYPSFEVIVVDNASRSDETRRVSEAAGVRYEREEAAGLDRARNRGLAVARYDIVAYTDDDVEVDPLWLHGIASAFADPRVRFVTGLVAPARMDTEAELYFELIYGGMGKGASPRLWNRAGMNDWDLIGAHHVGVGANMAFRRDLLVTLGGFDPALDVGTAAHGGGDLDIFHRALVAGAVGRYEPRALVMHHHRREWRGLERQLYDNGRAFGVYLLRILRRGVVPRGTVSWYAFRVWLLWLISRLSRRVLHRGRLPAPLILRELWGAASAPWAYIATYRRTRP